MGDARFHFHTGRVAEHDVQGPPYQSKHMLTSCRGKGSLQIIMQVGSLMPAAQEAVVTGPVRKGDGLLYFRCKTILAWDHHLGHDSRFGQGGESNNDFAS